MPMSRVIAARSFLPTLVASALLGSLSPQVAWGQSGSTLFGVGEAPRPQRAVRPAPSPAAPARTPPRRRGTAPAPAPDGGLTLNGRWRDSDCIPLAGAGRAGPLYVQREFQFDDGRKRWQLQASVYASSACLADARILSYGGAGSFIVSGQSRGAPNAYDAVFRIDRWSATPHTREGVLALLNDRCGSGDFEEGRPLDLSVTGCRSLGIRPVAQVPQENELVGLGNGSFFLGSRAFLPGQGDDRPAQLSSTGLVRSP
jgi:hypothetical protein